MPAKKATKETKETKETKARPLKKVGNHGKLTPAVTKSFIHLLTNHNTVKTACQHNGISQKTYYNWEERGLAGEEPYVQFLQSVGKAQAASKTKLIKCIARAAPKDHRAAAVLLKMLYPKEFTDNPVQVEANIAVNTGPQTVHQAIICNFPPVLAMRPPRPRPINATELPTTTTDKPTT